MHMHYESSEYQTALASTAGSTGTDVVTKESGTDICDVDRDSRGA